MMSTASPENSSSGCSTNNECGTKQIIDDIYIYDMPLTERRDLCMILDEQNIWEELAYKMGYAKKDVDVSFENIFFFLVFCFIAYCLLIFCLLLKYLHFFSAFNFMYALNTLHYCNELLCGLVYISTLIFKIYYKFV